MPSNTSESWLSSTYFAVLTCAYFFYTAYRLYMNVIYVSSRVDVQIFGVVVLILIKTGHLVDSQSFGCLNSQTVHHHTLDFICY